MRRGDRLFELIEILRQARQPISASSIAERLEVSKRTVYRDIGALMAQRVPIRGEAGVGYVLEAGFHMPPLMLTSDEIEAAILGAQWVQTRGDPGLSRAAESLVAKIEAVAPQDLHSFFTDHATSVAPIDIPDEVFSASEFRAAIRQRRKLRLRYRDEAGAITDRIVWPFLIGYRDQGRIVAAWCELREGYRYFRTERIIQASVLDAIIPKRLDRLRADWKKAMDAERDQYVLPANKSDENSVPAVTKDE
ncbi:YafY family protein [uncultured Roseibium sp.]|uniref:helix-turn-helix transcriptional regulator n=1 Tax=uncultured Roseibium sp. TaxID=1936171 RepID=UPI002630ED82|nr:YafY family protein [uncultured Roseibium sp.]